MRSFQIIRIYGCHLATFGHFIDDVNKEICRTLEGPQGSMLTDRASAGRYAATRLRSPDRDYETFEFSDVIGRPPIVFGVGHLPHETTRTICLGSNFGIVDGQEGVAGSRAAFDWFMNAMRGVEEFELTIVDPDITSHAAQFVAEESE